jgi:hypothetical protein
LSDRAFNDLSSPGFDPDAVLALLCSIGLSGTGVDIADDPLFLRSRVDRLEPRILALRDRVGPPVRSADGPLPGDLFLLGAPQLRRRHAQDPVLRLLVGPKHFSSVGVA